MEHDDAVPPQDGSSTTRDLDPRVRALFAEAVEKPEAERAEFLIRACADAALRAEVESLLFAHDLWEISVKVGKEPLAEQPGQVIDNYKLLQEIGSGGFGVVWMAEQLAPVRRKVALKILKLGMDTRQVVARFEAERQALAMMDHPNIAKVFDGGATERGRPYFVMELVRGEPLTRYCDETGLSIGERLRLFLAVCQAVQHAHTKGIIHRDLKPGNVLVTLHDGVPVPKVIDFGVAKATHRELTTKTLFTEFRQMLGTPEYMAPEQAELSGLDIDTRADVYSLGVLLYELLTGTRPFELKDALHIGCVELLRRIKEEEPQKPSTRVSTLGEELSRTARTRRVLPNALPQLLRRDLDWIVIKALEKDRGRRYETASAFAQDVQRHLDDLPVLARPPGHIYQFAKYLRRHRIAATAVAAVFLSLVIGLGAALLAKQEENKLRVAAQASENQAKTQANRAETVVSLIVSMLASSDPLELKGPNYTMGQWLQDFERELDLTDQPEVEATLRRTMGLAYLGLGMPQKAEPHLERALETRRRIFGQEDPIVAESLHDWARFLSYQGDDRKAEVHARHALAILNGRAGDDDKRDNTKRLADVFDSLSDSLKNLGRYREALASANSALELRRKIFGPKHRSVAASIASLASLLLDTGDIRGAERLANEALTMRIELLGEKHPDVADSLGLLGGVDIEKCDVASRERHARRRLEINRQLLGEHPHTAAALQDFAMCLLSNRDMVGAQRLVHESLAMRRKLLGDEHRCVAMGLSALAGVLYAQYDRKGAERYWDEALAMQVRLLGEEHLDVAKSHCKVAWIRSQNGDFPTAERHAGQALTIFRKLLPEDHPDIARGLKCLGEVLQDKGDPAGAERHHQEALATFRRVVDGDHPFVANTLVSLGNALHYKPDLDGAERVLHEAMAMLLRLHGREEHPAVASCFSSIGSVLKDKGDLDGAEKHLRRAVEIYREVHDGRSHPDLAAAVNNLGLVLERSGDFTGAEKHILEALAMKRECFGGKHASVALDLQNLGHMFLRKGDYVAAEERLREALPMAIECLGPEHPLVALTCHNLGDAQRRRGDLASAEKNFEASLAIRRKRPDIYRIETGHSLALLGLIRKARGDLTGAMEMLSESLTFYMSVNAAEDHWVANTLAALGTVLTKRLDREDVETILRECSGMKAVVASNAYPEVVRALAIAVRLKGETRQAMELLQRSLDLRRASGSSQDARAVVFLRDLAVTQEKADEIALARASHQEIVGILRTLYPGDTELADGLATFGRFLIDQKAHAEAEPLLRECLEIRTTKIPEDPRRYNAMSLLGGSLLGQGRHEAAEPLLLEGYERMAPSYSADHRLRALERIVNLYEDCGQLEKAAQWRTKLAAARETGSK
jgi:serine/threonine protein kinase/tetratricopeptide (TPR) repeat protein